jgi:hypothetical protein
MQLPINHRRFLCYFRPLSHREQTPFHANRLSKPREANRYDPIAPPIKIKQWYLSPQRLALIMLFHANDFPYERDAT